MTETSLERLLGEFTAEFSEPVSGKKGTTTVIPIDSQPAAFNELCIRMKAAGYTPLDMVSKHYKSLLKICHPKTIDRKTETNWDTQTTRTLVLAQMAVFDCVFGPNAKPLDPKMVEFYLQRAEELSLLILGKNVFEVKKEITEENTEYTEEDEGFFPHPEAKPTNPDAFKEPIPETIPDDLSWLAGATK